MIKKIIESYYKNPSVLVYYLFLYLILNLSLFILKLPSINAITDYTYFIGYNIFILFTCSIFLSLFLASAYLALKDKFSFLSSIKYIKFWKGNFIFLIVFFLFNLISLVVAKYTGILINNIIPSDFLVYIPYFQAIFQITLFFIFSCFFLFQFMFYTLDNNTILASMRRSFNFAKERFNSIIFIFFIYFFITFLMNFISNALINSAIYFLVIYPIFSLFLVFFFLKTKPSKKVN